MKHTRAIFLAGLIALTASAQVPVTPKVGLYVPNFNTPNWNIWVNDNWNSLDQLLSGGTALPGIHIIATTSNPGCSVTADIGKIWFNNTTSTTGFLTCVSVSGTIGWQGGGSMVYPPPGVPVSTGSGWGSSIAESSFLNGVQNFAAGPFTYDFTSAAHTTPAKVGTLASRPSTCNTGELYFATDATAGQQIYECSSTNVWTQQAGGGGATWGGITGTLSAQTDLQTALNGKQSTLTLPLSVANGGNGTATPALTQGTNVTITGSWPNYTISAAGGGGSGTVTTLSAPATIFSVSNPTTTPALLYATGQTANQIYGTNASGNAGLMALTLAQFPAQANNTVLGNVSGSMAVPSALTATNLNGLLATAPATSSTFGVVKVDNTTITASGGVISAVAGGSTVAIQQGGTPQGNAGTLNCSTNLTCSLAGGIATITATAGSGGGPTSSLTDFFTTGTSSTASVAPGTFREGNVTYKLGPSVFTVAAPTISTCTNASPIVCTLSSVSGLHNGDTVMITGVVGNTAANGTWVITLAGGSTIQLLGSTGSGTYTSGGVVAGSGSGFAYIEVTKDGNEEILHSSAAGMIFTCTGSCISNQIETPAFDISAYPVAEIVITGGALGAVTDERGVASNVNMVAGDGIAVTPSGGTYQVAVDSSVARTTLANNFTNQNTHSGLELFQPAGSQPTCSAANPGAFWSNNGSGSGNGSLQMCWDQSGTYSWVTVTSGGGGSSWSALTAPAANLTLAMGAFTTTFNFTGGGSDVFSAGNLGINTTPRQQLSVGSYLDLYSSDTPLSATVTSIRSTSIGNFVANAHGTGALYLNWDAGTGGTIFGGGAMAGVARVNSNGGMTLNSASDLATTVYSLYATLPVTAPSYTTTGTTPGAASLVAGTGSIAALTANSAGFAAPATGGTSYLFKLPGTITAGILTAAAPATADGVNESALTTTATTGTGNVVLSASPTLTGTATVNNLTVSGTCTGCGSGGSNTATFTAGTGGVTANLLVSKDTSNPTLVVAPAAGACGFGVAQSTASSGTSVNVAYNGVVTVVADGTITAGHMLTGGSTTPGRVADTGQSSRSLVPSTTCVIGFAQANATVGGTLSIILTLPNDFGTQVTQIVDANNNATVKSAATASAVDQLTVTNAATGGTVNAAATGSDTNIPLTIQGKGTGNLNLNGTSASVTPAGALTVASCSGCGSATVNAASLSNAIYCPDTSGAANTITCTTTTTYPAYAAGQSAIVKLANSVTGATTININSLGAKNVTKNGTTALASGDLVSGGLYLMTYDGTEYVLTQVLGGSGGSGTVNSGTATQMAYYATTGTAVSGTSAITIGGGVATLSSPVIISPTLGSVSSANGVSQQYTNDGTTGTAINELAIVSATNTAKTTATSTTDGVIGVCTVSCGTTGSSQITFTGAVGLTLDNTGTPGHWVQISSTTAGDGHDTGSSTFPTSGGQVIGQVVSNFAGSLYNVNLQLRSASGSGGGLPDPGANGPVYRSALNTTAPATADNLSQPHTCIAASASGSSYTCTTSPTFTPATGDMLYFKADVASSSGTVTLNANSSSAFGIYKQGGGTLIGANDLLAGQWTMLIFDASNHWEMQGQSGNAAGAVWSSLTNPTTTLTLTMGTFGTTFNTSSAAAAVLTAQGSSSSAVAAFGALGNIDSYTFGTAGSAVSGGVANSWFVKGPAGYGFDLDPSGDVFLGNALSATTGAGSAMQVYANGHIGTRGTAPTLSSCGTSTLGTGSTDAAGYITFAGTPSTCTLTWATAYTARPAVTVSSESAVAVSYTPSTTTLVITAGSLTGVVDYQVRALPN